MNIAAALAEIKALSVDERLEIMDAIWESIAAEPVSLEIPEEHRVELERRIANHEADPTKVIPWEEAKAKLLKQLGQ